MRGQHHTPAALRWEREQAPIVQETGRAPGWVWTVAENLVSPPLPPSGFNPKTVQSVVTRYTDWDIPAHTFTGLLLIVLSNMYAGRNLLQESCAESRTETLGETLTNEFFWDFPIEVGL
jgi:hypothetical protein